MLCRAVMQVTCTATVTIVLSSTGTGVGRVTVAGTWQSVLRTSRWPMTASSSSTGTSGTSLGVVTFTAGRSLPASTGNGCSFQVTAWSKAGLLQDTSAVLGPVVLAW